MLALVAADRLANVVAPPRRLREVEHAMADLRTLDPTSIAIGSSHGRTFATVADSLRTRTGGRERLLAVPVEWGKMRAYRWVLEERLLPLLDERRDDGTPVRPSLRRVILVTEWWDSCAQDAPLQSLPSRAWTWRHFAADLRRNGLTAYNTNFLTNQWTRVFGGSALVQDRGHGRILGGARQRFAPMSAEASRARFDARAADWQRMVDGGRDCIGDLAELAAFDAMLDTLQARGVEVTVLLYPRMPVTLSATAKATTLPAFAALVRARTEPRGIRLVDLTSTSPLTDDEFGDDFDHVLPAGNARFTGWALRGPLAFLLEPVR